MTMYLLSFVYGLCWLLTACRFSIVDEFEDVVTGDIYRVSPFNVSKIYNAGDPE